MFRMYDFKCRKCGMISEHLIRAGDLYPECCGCEMDRLLPVFRINMGPVPIVGYYDENLSTFITSNLHRKAEMEKQGVCERGATPKPNGQAWV